jgi:hypothetical protein
MPGDASVEELKAALNEVETNLANVRRTAEDIRSGIGEVEDSADRAQLIQSAAEQDGLAEGLEIRRQDLLSRIAKAQ